MTYARRKGFSIAECLILTIVLMLAIGAIYTTIGWSQINYVSSRRDRDSKELLFTWVQTFESLWPPRDQHNLGNWESEAKDCIASVGQRLGVWDAENDSAAIGGFTITVTPTDSGNGKIDLHIVMSDSGLAEKVFVDVFRSYNIFSTDTVPDDALQRGA